jgi:predicted RNase H-like HicB family nuclease
MKKAEKLVKQWQENLPAEARREDVILVLKHYFGNDLQLDQITGSHQIRIDHQSFEDDKTLVNGSLIIPVRKGRLIKKTYINKLLKAIGVKTKYEIKKNELLQDLMHRNYEIAIQQISDDDGGGWTACIPQLGRYTFISDGETREEALKYLEILKRELFEEALDKGVEIPPPAEPTFEKFTGQFSIKIPVNLHIELTEQAAKNGTSLNTYIVYLLTKLNTLEYSKLEKNILTINLEKQQKN